MFVLLKPQSIVLTNLLNPPFVLETTNSLANKNIWGLRNAQCMACTNFFLGFMTRVAPTNPNV